MRGKRSIKTLEYITCCRGRTGNGRNGRLGCKTKTVWKRRNRKRVLESPGCVGKEKRRKKSIENGKVCRGTWEEERNCEKYGSRN